MLGGKRAFVEMNVGFEAGSTWLILRIVLYELTCPNISSGAEKSFHA